MKVDVAWTGQEVDRHRVQGRTVVVIDVLRATTMIAALLGAGAAYVQPVTDVEEARRFASSIGREALLAGERGGLPPDGFDLGNSPLQVKTEVVRTRPVVLTTTNGTLAINRSLDAEALATAAFVNSAAVIDWLASTRPESLLLVCAGTQGDFSLDDCLCAGLLVSRLQEAEMIGETTDSALAARALYEHHRDDLLAAVSGCRHGRTLSSLGMGEDVTYALDQDVLPVLPIVSSIGGSDTADQSAVVRLIDGNRTKS